MEWRSSDLLRAFPTSMEAEVRSAITVMPGPMISPRGDAILPKGEFTVLVAGEQVAIPYRIYNEIPETSSNSRLSGTAETALRCLYTRHHDGYERERNLRKVVVAAHAWVVPFVIKLLGEYVIEIHQAIHDALSGISPTDDRTGAYADFVVENSEFLALIRQRAISYWNCYYRRRYPDRKGYPAFEVLDTLDQFRQ